MNVSLSTATPSGPPHPSSLTLRALVNREAERLRAANLSYGHGTDNALDEAAWLVLWQLGLPLDTPLDDSIAAGARSITPAIEHCVTTLIDRRITTRQPAAYLTREAWLQGVPFYCDERAIVPRSFIAELLADGSIDPWLSTSTRRVLDLCTGNGSLAVLAAMAYPEVEVTGADISSRALEVAHINVLKHSMDARIDLCLSDGLNQVKGRFDLVLCNPPYVNATSMAALPAEYRAEPELALAGGTDGMDFVRKLLQDLPDKLNDDGILVLEIGNERAHFEAAFPDLPVHWLATSAGEDQVLLIEKQDLVP
jgi:ribosomal protein L3 glutamine methyltransferase